MTMEMEFYEVDPKKVVRETYATVQELAKIIADLAKSKSETGVTLNTDFRWYASGLITPQVGRITNVSMCYAGDFSAEELLAALEAEGVHASAWSGQSSFFIVSTRAYKSFSVPKSYV